MKTTEKKHQEKDVKRPSSLKRLLRLSLKLSLLVFAFLFTLILLLHVPPIQNKIGRLAIRQISRLIDKDIQCDTFRVSLLGTIELNGVTILHNASFGPEPLASIKTLYIVFNPLSIQHDRFHIREIYAEDPVFRLMFNRDRISNLRIAGRPRRKRQNRDPASDEQMIRAVFNALRVDHIAIKNGQFYLRYAPTDYALDVPEFQMDARYSPSDDLYHTEISGGAVQNIIPEHLNSQADVSIKANVWSGGVSHALVTVTSNSGNFWLFSNCALEQFSEPHLKFQGSAITDLHEIARITALKSNLDGPAELFFTGNGPAENLDVTAECSARNIRFNLFNFASFDGSVRYFDRTFTIREATGEAYRGTYHGSGAIAFIDETKSLNIEAIAENADLAALTEDLRIPVQFPSRCNTSLRISGTGFKVEDIQIDGFVSGIETVGDSREPLMLFASYRMDGGLFEIPEAQVRGSTHDLHLKYGVFDKSQLRGMVSGQTGNIGNLLNRLNRYIPNPVTIPKLAGSAAFDLRLNGTLKEYTVGIDLNSSRITIQNQQVGSLKLSAVARPDGVDLNRITLTGPEIDVDGQLQLLLPLDGSRKRLPLKSASLSVSNAELSYLASFLERDLPISGTATGVIHVSDSIDPSSELSRLEVSSLSYAGIELGDTEIQGRALPEGLFDIVVSATPQGGRLNITADVPFQSPPDLSVSGRNLPIALVPRLKSAEISGTVDLDISTDTAGESEGFFRYSILSPHVSIRNIDTGSLEVRGRVIRAAPSVVEWSARWNQNMFTSDGTCTITEELPFTSTTSMKDLPLSIPVLIAAAGREPPPVSGHVTAGARFAGSLNYPDSWRSRIDIQDLAVDYSGIRLNLEEPTGIVMEKGDISITNARMASPTSELTATGTVSTRGEMALNVAGNLRLAPLEKITTFLENVSGNLAFNTSLSGSWKDPRFSGTLYLQEFYCHIPTFDVWLEDYHSEIELDQKLGKIVYLDGIAGGSYLGGEGELGFSGYTPDLLDIRLNGDDVDFEYPLGFDTMASVDLDISGALDEPMIAGDIEVQQSTYANRINYKTMIVNESRARLTFGDRRKDVRETREAGGFNPRFNLKINGPDNVFINNNLARVEMSIKLNILGALKKPQVLGHVDVINGEVTLLQRNFELMNASIEFADPTQIDPQVSLLAETDIDEYKVTLEINGRLYSDLNIQPSSTPPLNELDLWNLIVIGKTRENMASSSDYLASGVAYVTGSLQEQIEQRFEYWMGFDEFSIDPIMSTSDESPSAKFTVKKRFSPDLSVLYSRSASSSGDLLVIEYQVSDNLFIIGQKTEDNSIGADLRYRWEFE